MRIGSILENQEFEKRIAITPDIVKKYITLGFEVLLSENYGSHLGIKDDQFKELGAIISKDENEILNSSDIVVQLRMLDDDKSSQIKQNQSLIMTPQLQQAIKLLQLTNIELSEFIDKAQLENPFLKENNQTITRKNMEEKNFNT